MPCTPVHTSDATSIAIPMAYRDMSIPAPVGFTVSGADAGRGRDNVAMTTPNETMAIAIFVKGRKGRAVSSAHVVEAGAKEGKSITICVSEYRLPMKMRPSSMDTTSPGKRIN
jgi:hypothetical protein